ncbi:unnamed protein product [Calypogeia fissa]
MTQTRAQAALEELERAHGIVQVEVLEPEDLGVVPRFGFEEEGDPQQPIVANQRQEEGGGVRDPPIGVDQFHVEGERDWGEGFFQEERDPMGGRRADPGQDARQPIQRAKFQYKLFKAKEKEDPDKWLEDFVGMAKANGEDEIKLTTLAGVLKGEMQFWVKNQKPDDFDKALVFADSYIDSKASKKSKKKKKKDKKSDNKEEESEEDEKKKKKRIPRKKSHLLPVLPPQS